MKDIIRFVSALADDERLKLMNLIRPIHQEWRAMPEEQRPSFGEMLSKRLEESLPNPPGERES